MNKMHVTKWIYLGIFLSITGLIWGLSLSNGATSTIQSNFFVDLIKGFFNLFGVSLSGDAISAFSYLVRKFIGHFGIFLLDAVFGWLTLLSFSQYKGWKLAQYSIFLVLFVALGSEGLQLLTSGRAGLLSDVAIDMSGAVLGIAICHSFKKSDKAYLL